MKSPTSYFLFFIFSLLMASCSKEKQQQENIKADFTTYVNAIKSKDVDKAVNSIYPRFFEIVSKDQMKKMLEAYYNNPEIEFKVKKYNIENAKEVKESNGLFYTVINYQFQYNLTLNSEDLQSSHSTLLKAMEERFGAENVTYDGSSSTFDINTVKKAIGVSQDGLADWKFVILEDEYKAYLADIIPQNILYEN